MNEVWVVAGMPTVLLAHPRVLPVGSPALLLSCGQPSPRQPSADQLSHFSEMTRLLEHVMALPPGAALHPSTRSALN